MTMKTSDVVRSMTFLFSSNDERKQSMRLIADRVALLEDFIALLASESTAWQRSMNDYKQQVEHTARTAQGISRTNEDFWAWHDGRIAKWRDAQTARSPDVQVATFNFAAFDGSIACLCRPCAAAHEEDTGGENLDQVGAGGSPCERCGKGG